MSSGKISLFSDDFLEELRENMKSLDGDQQRFLKVQEIMDKNGRS
jgi:hypothetical protein